MNHTPEPGSHLGHRVALESNDLKITDTMLQGLLKMAKKLELADKVMAYPSENTGKALLKRGLIVQVSHSSRSAWPCYALTELGKKVVADHKT